MWLVVCLLNSGHTFLEDEHAAVNIRDYLDATVDNNDKFPWEKGANLHECAENILNNTGILERIQSEYEETARLLAEDRE